MAKAKPDQTELNEVELELQAAQGAGTETETENNPEPAETEITSVEETDEVPTENEAESAESDHQDTKVTKAGPKSRKALEEAEAEAARKEAAKEAKPETAKPRVIQKRNPLKLHGKNYRKAAELVDRTKEYELTEAIELAQKTTVVKFVPSLELHVRLGVDPRQADQMVRANVTLPAGTGKTVRIAVLAPTAKQADAKKAEADLVGDDDLIAKIEKGMLDFDKLIATPDVMPKLGKLAKILGPKGLMPNPKSGSVTNDIVKAVSEAKAGKIEFRIDKQAIVHQAFGKADFKPDDLLTNVKTLIHAIMKAKPGAAKGTYVKGMALTTSMGPGIKLNVTKAIAESNPKK